MATLIERRLAALSAPDTLVSNGGREVRIEEVKIDGGIIYRIEGEGQSFSARKLNSQQIIGRWRVHSDGDVFWSFPAQSGKGWSMEEQEGIFPERPFVKVLIYK